MADSPVFSRDMPMTAEREYSWGTATAAEAFLCIAAEVGASIVPALTAGAVTPRDHVLTRARDCNYDG